MTQSGPTNKFDEHGVANQRRQIVLRISGWFIAVATVLAILFVMFAPDHRVEAVKATWRRANGDNGQTCLDTWAGTLKDPQSAQLVSTTPLGANKIMVGYRAKNDYGAYKQGFFDCPLKNGEVDTFAITMQISDEALESYLKSR
jgi:hypothetical protein